MSCYVRALKNCAEYQNLIGCLKTKRTPLGVLGLPPVAKAHIIFSLCLDFGCKALVLMPDEASALKACEDVNVFSGGSKKAVFYPVKDFCYTTLQRQSKEFEHLRIAALHQIIRGDYDFIFCAAQAALQFTIPPEEMISRTLTFKTNSSIQYDECVRLLTGAGYTRSDMVEGPGQFSLRGGILDIFPTNEANPVRIELWGDEIDTISEFDVSTQRRTERKESISIAPSSEVLFNSDKDLAAKLRSFCDTLKGKGFIKARENILRDADFAEGGAPPPCLDKYINIAYEKNSTLFDYLDDCVLIACETSNLKNNLSRTAKLEDEDIKSLFEDGTLTKGLNRFTLRFSDLLSFYEKKRTLYFDNFPRGSFDTPIKELISFNVVQQPPWGGALSVLLDDIRPAIRSGYTLVITASTRSASSSLARTLENEGLPCIYLAIPPAEFPKNKITVFSGALSFGLMYPNEKLMIITLGRISATTKLKKRSSFKAADAVQSLEELCKGDYIVHASHGIGIFDGITKMNVGGLIKDYIKINYDKGDVLYIPITQLDLVSKYIGQISEDKPLKLSRIGSKEWEKTKERVKCSVKDIAKELIALYSKRLKTEGFAFSPDIDMQNDFERRFIYEETEDQQRSVDEIKNDMEQIYPMDRLLCGDVGFGKTEVALRAAFKCIADGKQCAFLVPTTILALQHYQTILKRFDGFPVSCEMISRFKTAKEQVKILKDLRLGKIDFLVGTHRLISKDVKFRDLGLLIIDEEQRFGVAQKERLKELFPTVDCLTLTATPIPRTLNMAMSGIRDMSIIEEAPSDRFPVQTYVLEYDRGILHEAIKRELRRGGQVFYLHNRVETIERVAAAIKEDIPEANVAVGHGKMSEEELSSIWRSLLEGETDILVCTTIIETGVDVQNVNTLIIEDADNMGLSQLHQLRGRVGRSARRAFAYFTFRRNKQLNETASRRLRAIREYTQFGSGFKIAMRDLEIRGAGNLLGAQQHGHLESVGYDMYMKLLVEAIREEKGEKPKPVHKECLVDIQIDAHIPQEYIESLAQRISIYKRIADIENEEDALDVKDELIDRFGEPPASVLGLIQISLLRNTASALGIFEIGQKGYNLLLYQREFDMSAVSALAKNMRGRILVSAGTKPYISIKKLHNQSPLEALNEALKIMQDSQSGKGDI
ncbi:MAG: Transcription-repair-coupling factor [Firmicutes bacterium ADurb.Bin300]|nr:MAG: Transcription-repair-coupling factor [Firmicutes bacterium ADurb.Bin300]